MPNLSDRRKALAAVEQEGEQRAATIQDVVRDMLPRFAGALPRGTVDPQQFLNVVLTELRANPRLAEATRVSLLGALMNAAELGLSIQRALGWYYLTGPFRMRGGTLEVVPIIGYRGYITLALRDERVLAVKAEVVREGDTFEHEYGDNEHLRHVPALDSDGRVVAAWAQATMETPSGQLVRVHKVVSIRDVEMARARSKAKDDGPWVTDFGAMARKTAVLRLLRGGEVPLRLDAATALAHDERPIHYDVEASEVLVPDEPVIEAVATEAEDEPEPEQQQLSTEGPDGGDASPPA
jgi:recombination protein RecT